MFHAHSSDLGFIAPLISTITRGVSTGARAVNTAVNPVQSILQNVYDGAVAYKQIKNVISPPAAPAYSAGSTGERLIPTTTLLAPVETPLNRTEIATLQSALMRHGIDPGPIDGVYGPKTAAAIQQWQSRNFLPADGRLSRSLYHMVTAAFLAPSGTPIAPIDARGPTGVPVTVSEPRVTMTSAPAFSFSSPALIAVGAALLAGAVLLSGRRR